MDEQAPERDLEFERQPEPSLAAGLGYALGAARLGINVMKLEDSTGYRAGLDRIQESVISSHFMHELCRDYRLDQNQFSICR